MFERTIYANRAATGISERSACEIILGSHNGNRQVGVAGVLISLDGCFLQVLEGDGRTVRQRFAVIAGDRRRSGLGMLQHGVALRLAFPDEWVAFRSSTEIAAATEETLPLESLHQSRATN